MAANTRLSASEAAKIQEAKDAKARENYKAGTYSDKTYEIAKKQGALNYPDGTPSAKTTKDAATLNTIQQNRKNDLSRTASRASMIESRKKK